MKTTKMNRAEKVLKQYRSNYYLAGLELVPHLTEEGRVENLDEFTAIKNKTRSLSSCDTPVEKLAAFAPKAVAVILEAIDEMDGAASEKQVLFDVYVKQTKAVEEVDEDLLDKAYVAFIEVYNEEVLVSL